jgi:hypothetical protein
VADACGREQTANELLLPAIGDGRGQTMSTGKRHKIILIGAMLSCVGFSSSASSRPWKPTPTQIAADYASITHIRGNGDFVTIGWWASPTARPGTQLVAILEKYVLISVSHAHQNFNQPAAGISFDDIKTLGSPG